MYGIARPILETLLTRAIAMGVGVAVSIILARELGPSGRGDYASTLMLVLVCAQVGNLGFPASNTYFASRRDGTRLLANSIIFSVVSGVALAIVVLVAIEQTLLADSSIRELSYALMAWPLLIILGLLLQGLLLGKLQYRLVNLIELGQRVLLLAGLVTLVSLKALSVNSALVLTLAVAGIAIPVSYAAVARDVRGLGSPALELFAEQLKYGLRIYSAALFTSLLMRFDILLVHHMLGAHDAGQLSVVISVADAVLTIPVVVGTVLFPRLASQDGLGSSWQSTVNVAKIVAGVLFLALLILSTFAREAFALLFGEAFTEAGPLFVLLSPGLFFLGLTSVVSSFVAARGQPLAFPFAALACFALDLGIELAFLKNGVHIAPIAISVTSAALFLGALTVARSIHMSQRC